MPHGLNAYLCFHLCNGLQVLSEKSTYRRMLLIHMCALVQWITNTLDYGMVGVCFSRRASQDPLSFGYTLKTKMKSHRHCNGGMICLSQWSKRQASRMMPMNRDPMMWRWWKSLRRLGSCQLVTKSTCFN